MPHATIRISIQRSRYNTYLDTYLNTVRRQRDDMSSMKAETPVIRSPAHNLLLQWMEYLLLQLPMLSQDVTLLSYIRVFPSIWSEKTMCFNSSRSRIPVYIVSCESRYTGFAISIRIVVTKYRCIAMHRWIVTPLLFSSISYSIIQWLSVILTNVILIQNQQWIQGSGWVCSYIQFSFDLIYVLNS